MVDQFYVNNVYKQVYKNIVTLTMQTALFWIRLYIMQSIDYKHHFLKI